MLLPRNYYQYDYSIFLSILIIILILILCVCQLKPQPTKEGFSQIDKFVYYKDNDKIFDNFYSEIYDDLFLQ